MNKSDVEKIVRKARENGMIPDLRGTNLRGANLSEANLCVTDLRGADIDFSCWPLWCGSNGVNVDAQIAAQLAAHGAVVIVDLDTAKSDDERQAVENWQAACRALGIFSHRADDLGLLEE